MRNKILIVEVNWIGDVLFSTPFISAVRQAHPGSHIACLIHPRTKEMLAANPLLNEIILYDEEGSHKGVMGKLLLAASLRKKKFDTAFILHRSFTKALITKLAGIKERIGFATKKRSGLLTLLVEEPPLETHKVEYFLALAKAAGISVGSAVSYDFRVEDSSRRFIGNLLHERGLGENDRIVVLCPGGNWDPKRWPKENFAQLADHLAEKFKVKIVISGAAKDTKIANAVENLMRTKPIITCGLTTLNALGALFERSSLVIANDSGPMHLAVAVKANTVALFGPTSPAITGPYGAGNYRVISKHESCDIPCYDVTCKDNRCMAAITVEDVLREAERMLAG